MREVPCAVPDAGVLPAGDDEAVIIYPESTVVLPGHVHLVVDLGVDHGHGDLVVDDVRHEVPVPLDLVLPLGQLVELLQRQLSEVVPVQLQRHQRVVRLQTLRDHLQAVVVDVVPRHVQVDQGAVLRQGLRDDLRAVVPGPVRGEDQRL